MATTALPSTQASAQAAADNGAVGLEEIVVTAQKRAQNLQDVPVAVTALDTETLEVNRVFQVTDLNGLAPGVTARASAGANQLPIFAIRGALSVGVTPGSDKQVPIYLDGVYIAASDGSSFDLPDLQRIEVLRGPQGTLFGRNATAGAIGIFTREPDGDPGVRLKGTLGNHDHRRFTASVDLPQMGAFSAYVSYQREKRRGDIRNLGAGQLWDRRNSQLPRISGVSESPKWLGSKDSNAFFGALKFEEGGFKTVYKFDYYKDKGTPEGTAPVAIDRNFPLLGPFLNTLITSQATPVVLTPIVERPKALNQAFASPRDQTAEGHSLTTTYEISDSLTVKNILAYRKSFIFAATSLDGFSSLPLTAQAIGPYATFVAFSTIPGLAQAPPAVQGATIQQVAAGLTPLIGSNFLTLATQITSRSRQMSDEIQFNYDSDLVTATFGALWFRAELYTAEMRLTNTTQFTPIIGSILPNRNIGEQYNKIESIAAYSQLEFHVNSQLDVVLGARITKDRKNSRLLTGADLSSLTSLHFPEYKNTRPSYLAGVNYKPSDNLLVYGKYSTGYVSGGAVGGVPYAPETVKSWEGGVKTELFDRKVRTNLALYHAAYTDVQSTQSVTSYVDYITQVTGDPTRARVLGTIIVPSGDIEAKGFELEVAAAPTRGVTLGGAVGYTKTKYKNPDPRIASGTGGVYRITVNRPKWSGNVYAQYDSDPLFGETYLTARVDAIYQGKNAQAFNPALPIYNGTRNATDVPAYWLLNGRVGLADVDIAGRKAQVALWGRNLTDQKKSNFGLNLGFVTTANFLPARSYGIDVTFDF